MALSPPTTSPQPHVTRWPSLRVYEHHLLVYRRTWRGTLFTTFLSPVLFLTAMGLGLGRLVVPTITRPGSWGVSYLAFLAPGLLASTAMQTAAFESTYPIMGAGSWQPPAEGMISTPIAARSVVLGQVFWVITRLAIVTSVFTLVMFAFGTARFPDGLIAMPFAVLTGLAFAAPIQAFAATQRNDTIFNAIFRFGITPLFIFSGTFFPVEQLPAIIQPIAWVTPLFHGVALTRGVALGTFDLARRRLIHVAALLAFVAIGVAASFVTFRRPLVK